MSDTVLKSKPPNFDEIIPEEYLIESDGEPIDTPWHRRGMNLLIESVEHHCRNRQDYYVGGNMFIYFSPEQARNKDYRGPDFFFVWNSTRLPDRRFWYVWEERRTPNVVIELVSPTTRHVDYGMKKEIYEQILRVNDYFCFDPDGNVLNGWRLHGREYASLSPNEKGWLWCEDLQLWLGAWEGKFDDYDGTYPRFYDPAGNLVVTGREADSVDACQQRAWGNEQKALADEQKARADEQKARADEQKARADEQKARADEQKARADRAEAELMTMRERLLLLEKTAAAPDAGGNGKK